MKSAYKLCGKEVLDGVISLDLIPLDDFETLIPLQRSSGRRFFRDNSFVPSFFTLLCPWKMVQNLDCDRISVLLTVLLFSTPPFKQTGLFLHFFQKAHWDCFVFYFDSHCLSTEKYFSLSSAAGLFTSLILIAAKFSILFGRVIHQPQAW